MSSNCNVSIVDKADLSVKNMHDYEKKQIQGDLNACLMIILLFV
jgi:hypothetical protein